MLLLVITGIKIKRADILVHYFVSNMIYLINFNNLSIYDLSNFTGLGEIYINDLLLEIEKPTIEDLVLFSKFFSVNVDALISADLSNESNQIYFCTKYFLFLKYIKKYFKIAAIILIAIIIFLAVSNTDKYW